MPFLPFPTFLSLLSYLSFCFLYSCSLAAFTFAHLRPLLLLACCLYLCRLLPLLLLACCLISARLMWLNFLGDSLNGLQLTMKAYTCFLSFFRTQLGVTDVSFDFTSTSKTAFLSSENPFFGPGEMRRDMYYFPRRILLFALENLGPRAQGG